MSHVYLVGKLTCYKNRRILIFTAHSKTSFRILSNWNCSIEISNSINLNEINNLHWICMSLFPHKRSLQLICVIYNLHELSSIFGNLFCLWNRSLNFSSGPVPAYILFFACHPTRSLPHCFITFTSIRYHRILYELYVMFLLRSIEDACCNSLYIVRAI